MKNAEERHLFRAKGMQEINALFYQPYHKDCRKMIWRRFIRFIYGCNYATFLQCLKKDTSSLPQGRSVIEIFREIVEKYDQKTGQQSGAKQN